MGQRAIPSGISRHSYHPGEQTVKNKKLDYRVYSVIAWRVFYATMLARAVPDMPCSVLLEIEEWQALYCAIHHCPTPPAEPPTLGEAVRWIAQLGGFVGRRRRDHPGAEPLRRGLQHLRDLTRMYCIMRPAPP